MEKHFLIMAKSTNSMLQADRLLRSNEISTGLVPAPPEHGSVCAIAIRVADTQIAKARELIQKAGIELSGIFEEKPMKLAGLLKEFTAVTGDFLSVLTKIEAGEELSKSDIITLLEIKNEKELEILYSVADRVRKEVLGDVVDIRGAIEFSNYCRKKCSYCGINATVKAVNRYRMQEDEILAVVHELHKVGLKTVILQSGEDTWWTAEKIVSLVKRIKSETGMKITLSVGEWTYEEYELFKNAGADNFLLKIETTNKDIFRSIHPDDDYDYRLQCARWLKELGYINGSGCIIGLPGQTVADIANDIIYFKDMGINMIGIGPFIPAEDTPLENHPTGDIQMTLKAVAVTRIVCKKVYIPSTTALASLDKDAQVMALKAGANTIMLINTPSCYRDEYNIYDNKNPVDMQAARYAISKAGRVFPEYIRE